MDGNLSCQTRRFPLQSVRIAGEIDAVWREKGCSDIVQRL